MTSSRIFKVFDTQPSIPKSTVVRLRPAPTSGARRANSVELRGKAKQTGFVRSDQVGSRSRPQYGRTISAFTVSCPKDSYGATVLKSHVDWIESTGVVRFDFGALFRFLDSAHWRDSGKRNFRPFLWANKEMGKSHLLDERLCENSDVSG